MVRWARMIWRGVVACALLAAVTIFGLWPALRWHFPMEYRETVEKHADEHQLDPLLVLAVMRVESRFDPEAVSAKGARGLMQVMPETAAWAAQQMGMRDFDVDQLFIPEINVAIGAWYLSTLRTQFHGDTVLALAAYNGGRTNVLRWLNEEAWSGHAETVQDIPFPETRGYVQKVLATYAWYRRLYGPSNPLVRWMEF